MTEIERFIREAAKVRGIDPDIAVRVALSEGGVELPAALGDFSGPPWHSGKSWWPFQLHYGGPGYEEWGGTAGMGNGFTALTGWQPGDPAAWRDSVRYALNRAKKDGWGAWYGADAAGIGKWDGIDRAARWDANAEVWDFERAQAPAEPEPSRPKLRTTDAGVRLRDQPAVDGSKILATLPQGTVVEPLDERAWRRVRYGDKTGWMAADFLEDAPAGPVATSLAYDPDFALRLQVADWACSVRTTQMMLESIGIPVDIGTLQDQMVPEYVSTSVGLRDGSGAGIVEVMQRFYGVIAESHSPATWDGVTAVAGTLPVGLGGHGWGGVGHWVAVRRYRAGALELANPGGTGPVFGQQRIDQATWNSLANWWSAVVITGRST